MCACLDVRHKVLRGALLGIGGRRRKLFLDDGDQRRQLVPRTGSRLWCPAARPVRILGSLDGRHRRCAARQGPIKVLHAHAGTPTIAQSWT